MVPEVVPITNKMAMVEYAASTEPQNSSVIQTEDKVVTLGGVVRQTTVSIRSDIETNSPEYKANLARFTKLAKLEPYSITTRSRLLIHGEPSASTSSLPGARDGKPQQDNATRTAAKLDEKSKSRDASQISNALNDKSDDYVPNPNILISNKFHALEDPILLQNEQHREQKELLRSGQKKNSGTKTRSSKIIQEEGILSYSIDPATRKSIHMVRSKSYHGRYILLGHTGELCKDGKRACTALPTQLPQDYDYSPGTIHLGIVVWM
ncbi:hypothetical protein DM860_014827 [Cuscuta australis]|uniref:Uncharacterized protein n=1 Tax=Cuscuta australis TaxID=267555 RepID=A0A328DLB3_9ASTE|nr:hypothetical protein DM860_014827 [Cuscuta australis]